ncbi:MAG: 2Fe-2S iron-sulfur cluster-binding protein [Pseudomonadota bacterium]|nr:2Fe-2S iron-sulfur cluster-binding protein [Pseudomonadota bacterium]
MKLKFMPQNVEYEVTSDQSVLHVAQDNGIHIKSVCKGVPSCAECRVFISEGEQNVMPPSPQELSLIGTAYFVDQRRLSCQLHCFGDVTIDLSEQIEKAENALVGKKPRGARDDFDPKESNAVMGNVIFEEKKQAPQKQQNPPRQQNQADVEEKKFNRMAFEEEKKQLLRTLREQRAERERLKLEQATQPTPKPESEE